MHKKVLEEYQKSGMELPQESANETNIRMFYAKQKLSQKPIKREIKKIVRLREKGQEYFYYGQELESRDSLGNEIHVYIQPIGKYEKPAFDYITDPNTKSRIATSIRSTETVYDLKWPEDWLKNKDLDNDVSSKVDLLLAASGRLYGGFSYEDFTSKSFEDLLMIGKYGTIAPTPGMIQVVDQRRVEADKAKRHR